MSSTDQSIASNTQRLVQCHADLLSTLPEPPETFVASDLPKESYGVLKKLQRRTVLEVVGWKNYEGTRVENDRLEYRLEDWVVDEVEAILNDRDAICPCGHSGLRNHGDYYECGFVACDREFDRAELEVDDAQ